ncbi:MAG: pyridoxamine 5'-phosphate oxidase family protein [Candidatus Odinarchaeota archaeon]
MDLLKDSICEMSDPYLKFLLNAKYLYCCTLDRYQNPHVVPLIFTFVPEDDGCLIRCLIERNSVKAKNMRQNPYVTFASDENHPTIPLLNSGIMIETLVELDEDLSEINRTIKLFQEKYAEEAWVPYACNLDADILMRAYPQKIIYWKGPYFQRFRCSKHWKKRASI